MDINEFSELKQFISDRISHKVHHESDKVILFSVKDLDEENKFLVTDLENGLFSLCWVVGFDVKMNNTFNLYDNIDYICGNIKSFIDESIKKENEVVRNKKNGHKNKTNAASKQSEIDRAVKEKIKIIFADLFQRMAGKYLVGYDGDFVRITDLETIEVEIYCCDGKIFVECPMSKFVEYQQGFKQEFDVSHADQVIDTVLGLFTQNKTRDQFKRAVIHNVKKNLHSRVYYENKETGGIVHSDLHRKGGLTISIVSNGKEYGHFVVKDLSDSNISDFCDAALKISDRFKTNE